MSEIESALRRIADLFTVKDIMTHRSELRTATSNEEAEILYKRYEYETVPYMKKDRSIAGYRKKQKDGSWKCVELRGSDMISDGTSVTDFIELLENGRESYFVLSSNSVEGLVHFADLNAPVAAMPVSALLTAVEDRLWKKIENKVDETVIRNVFAEGQANAISERFERSKRNDVDRGWGAALFFSDILYLAEKLNVLPFVKDKQVLNDIPMFRNNTVHAAGVLIASHEHVKRLRNVQRYCKRILEEGSQS